MRSSGNATEKRAAWRGVNWSEMQIHRLRALTGRVFVGLAAAANSFKAASVKRDPGECATDRRTDGPPPTT